MEIKTLSIDIESYSDVDIGKCGVYKYSESENFEILLFAYAVNSGEVQVVDLAQGEKIPVDILKALSDERVTKWAFNSQFERIALSMYIRRLYPEYFVSYSTVEDTVGDYLSPVGWKCTMTWSAYMGLPLSLEGVGKVLGLDEQKLKEGKELIHYFCIPCKPTKTNGSRTRNLPQHAIEKWELFKFYNKRDVEVELNIQRKLANFPVPDSVWEEFWLDQEINDRGIMLDMDVVKNAIALDEISHNHLMDKLKEITGLVNPNSVIQMRGWLSANGLDMESLGKKNVAEAIKTAQEPLKSVLQLRLQLAKSSVKKYQAMEKAACKDSRARGMFRFYGANRSGRWSGKIVQLQNLARNSIPDLAEARAIVKYSDYDVLEMLYDNVPDTLSQLVRTALIPRHGMKFIVADFSSIEARVLAWLAGETRVIESFAQGKDLYCVTASAMFGVPVEKHGINGDLRQKGKIATLACGYGGSVGALTSMGALDMGLKEEELLSIVTAWRKANQNIVNLWWEVDRYVKHTVHEHIGTKSHGITFRYKSGMLFIDLPSGRSLVYVKPRIGENKFGGESVTYEGISATRKWERIESYGPKFVENIVQAIARDILAYAMRTLAHSFICAHVHDEVIIECRNDVSLEAICEQMGRTPPWAEGLLLRADGYECDFYKKD